MTKRRQTTKAAVEDLGRYGGALDKYVSSRDPSP